MMGPSTHLCGNLASQLTVHLLQTLFPLSDIVAKHALEAFNLLVEFQFLLMSS